MNECRLINEESAAAYLNEVSDPVMNTVMDLAYMIILKKYRHPTNHRLTSDLDLRFLTEVLVELFANRELIKKVLDGERPGAWDD